VPQEKDIIDNDLMILIIQVTTSPNVCFCTTWGKTKQAKYELKWTKNIHNIITDNLKKDYKILIIICTNITETIKHQMNVQVPTSPNVCFCTTWQKQEKQNMHLNEKNVNKFHLSGSVAYNSPDLSPFAYNVCGVMQQRVYRTQFRKCALCVLFY